MSSDFPLLRLPEKALNLVIQCMEYIEIVGFSLASNKTKETVKSLNLQITTLFLTTEEIIKVHVRGPSRMFWNFYPGEENAGNEPFPVYMPACVTARRGLTPEILKYLNPGYSIQKWIDTVQYIFSHPVIDYLIFKREICKFDMSSLMETIGTAKVKAFFFYDQCRVECAKMAVSQFPGISRMYAKSQNMVETSRYTDVLMQNLDVLSLGHDGVIMRMEFDNLLLINSKEITIRSRDIKDKMINQFLKHWIGGSNPRMEFTVLLFPAVRILDINAILRGLNFHEAPLDQVRLFTKPATQERVEIVGGYDIRRVNGSVGTLKIEQRADGRGAVIFCVWN
ncbi:hypothetical protein GCK72_022384 [Caenorhabditis remanei]|uniref:F-box domain-containing protein n=1 Tax=Caenorhabditis remanei TaxID=31234 RepID=A0A6A5FTW2_CAERE|nr:hypothetical protein GCK72_022384 [Caenorhabditis remanei]KAF1745936.1 hypothetical protein GCK72_022384 [Caenorhabditis remanei]